jgi:rRNA maturation endonuclease Nob1
MGRRYVDGYRYCSRCHCYRETSLDRCPECGTLMRRKPRKKKGLKAIELEAVENV